MITHPTRRRIARVGARIGVVGSAAMLAVTTFGMSTSGLTSAAAATDGGPAVVTTPIDAVPDPGAVLEGGGSATPFTLRLPTGAACTGDSAGEDYRVQSYMVPASVAPGSITFDSGGPTSNATGADFRQPLYDTSTSGYIDQQTANADPAGGPGPVIDLPAFDFAVFAPGHIPAGTYNVGIACTLGGASATQLDKFWNVQLAFLVEDADEPAGVTWTVVQGGSTTTTTTGGTTTTAGGSTTTTTEGGTTTTSLDGGSTTTTVAVDGSTDAGGAPTGSVVGGITALPVTGGSTMAMVVWSALLVVFGRMAVLLGRPPRLRPARL